MNYEYGSEFYAMVSQKGLLSMSGSMKFHSYMAQVDFESSHGVFLLYLCTMICIIFLYFNMHYVMYYESALCLCTMNMDYVMFYEYASCYVLWILSISMCSKYDVCLWIMNMNMIMNVSLLCVRTMDETNVWQVWLC